MIPDWVNNDNFPEWRKQLKWKLYRERGGVSDYSGRSLRSGCHMHEGIVSRAVVPRGIRWHYQIYHAYNSFLLLPNEHIPNPPNKEWAIETAYRRYGRDVVREWFYSLPWKVIPFQLP